MPTRIAGFKLLNFASDIDDNTLDRAKQTASTPFVHPHVDLTTGSCSTTDVHLN